PTPPSSGVAGGTAAVGGVPSNRASEGILANFFTSLINKKPNVAATGTAGVPTLGQESG
ncbi:hypothetical protein P879_11664, partial [Paragonimus westermani]